MKDFKIISSLLKNFTESFCFYDECKKKIEISHLSNIRCTKQPLKNNDIFEYKETINMLHY